nr:hypothetical protein [Tanacetum cinerariifolium]
MKSIEDSRFYIIVFSKNYASSSWCLDELVMDESKLIQIIVEDIFKKICSKIRKQSGPVEEAFKKAFEKHENKEAAGRWSKALNEAGNLAGWESKKTANGNLVGMETRIEAFLSSLELDAHEVRVIGIWGMGGGGKTTLARAVFDRISYQFEGKAFVENVREVSKSSLYGLNKLQGQILCSVLHVNIPVRIVHEGTNMMKTLLRGRKVLIFLDDVDDREQLEVLAEEMGKNIVRRVNPDKPERHSRLWIQEEIEEILANDS